MRLDKFIADSSDYSRADAKKLIRAGAAEVNGKKVRTAEYKVTENDTVCINGKKLVYTRYVYLMLNKPQGYLSAVEDKHDPVVTDLIPEQWKHFKAFPVGRLDKDTEGLLLLTNDGQFDHALTSPRRDVAKRYYAELDQPAVPEDTAVFAGGMEFQDFTAKPALLEITEDPCKVYITISEGKFHQVKRMCERIGKQVRYLKRVSIGSLELDDTLAPGAARELTEKELALFL